MTATSDEDGGGPFGRSECLHDTAEEAEACELCDEYVSSVAGFPSKKRMREDQEKHERAELERLKAKYSN